MQATLQPEASSIRLEFDDLPAVKKFFADAEQQAGFFLQLDHELKQFERLSFTATAPSFRFRFEAEVVQVFPAGGSYGSAFQLSDWTPAKTKDLERRLGGKEEVMEGEHTVSPMFRIKKMNVSERFRLAPRASRPERQILLRDTSPQVLLGLLAHPRIEDKEVKTIIDSNFASGAIMQRVAGNRRWMSNPEIQLAVVRSPKTPPPLAIKMLPFLRTTDLRKLAKIGAAREVLRRAALKVYMERTGRRG